MPTVILHIAPPNRENGQPSICLEDFEPTTGKRTMRPDASDEMPVELSDEECNRLLEDLWRADRNSESAVCRAIGVALYGYVAVTSAGQKWIELCQQAALPGQPELRTYLYVEDPALQRLPWELMADDEAGNPFAPFRSINHFAARWKPPEQANLEDAADDILVPTPIQMPEPILPLSIIVAIYDMPLMTDDEWSRMGPQVEVDAIYAALRNQPGIWQVEVLWYPTEKTLSDSLQAIRPQILHFIGEASHVPGLPDGKTELAFTVAKPDGQHDRLTLPALERMLFEMGDGPRLFILNGCWTNFMASPKSFDKLHCKAVIANQAKVYGAPAITFTKNFYGKLAVTSDVTKAVREARVALWKIQGEDLQDWGIPVLTLYGGPETVIQSLIEVSREAEALIRTGDFMRPERHFDRLSQSRQLWNCVNAEHDRRNIVLLCGYYGTGKSALLRNCMLTWKLRGYPAVLFDAKTVPVGDRSNIQIETILDYICEALEAEVGTVPEIGEELAKVRAAVQQISFNDKKSTDALDPYVKPCSQFISFLKMATKGKPLMLAFDSISSLFRDDPDRRYRFGNELSARLNQYLFEPIARGAAGNAYLVIAATIFGSEYNEAEDLLNWRGQWWDEWVKQVRLEMFSGGQAGPLGHEYSARRGWIDGVDREVHDENGNRRMAELIGKIEAEKKFDGRWFPFELSDFADKFWRDPAEGLS